MPRRPAVRDAIVGGLHPATAAAQTLTADINGDGVRDRIETRRAPGGARRPAFESEPAQHLRFSGSILDIVVTDVDADGDSDLVATTTGRPACPRASCGRMPGRGKLVSRCPEAAQIRWHVIGSAPATDVADRPSPDGDLCGDAVGLFVADVDRA